MARTGLQKKVGTGRHLSSIKRHRQSLKRCARNKHITSNLKTTVKKLRSDISAKNKESASSNLKVTIATLNKAATKGVIPAERASRLSSRLTKAVTAIG